MRGETQVKRGQLRGYMFEIIIRYLLKMNDFEQISTSVQNKINVTNDNKIEIKGRGTWHQIDSPCIYKKYVPFIYDIRLLAEVKFYSSEIQKSKIREYIGVIKDISENYFIDSVNTIENQKRYTDIGVFFAINGFQTEAEKLAFAHGIKTVSYSNNQVMNNIKPVLESLECDCLKGKYCISAGNQKDFMNQLSNILLFPDQIDGINEFRRRFRPEGAFIQHINSLSVMLRGVKSSFFGVTGTNYFIHFISNDEFPRQLFLETDERECRIYYEEDGALFFLRIMENNDPHNAKFHFSAPKPILEEIFYGGSAILDEKGRHFSVIKISIAIDGINRNLVLKLDNKWIDDLKRRKHKL
jgi:hypothetical protein